MQYNYMIHPFIGILAIFIGMIFEEVCEINLITKITEWLLLHKEGKK